LLAILVKSFDSIGESLRGLIEPQGGNDET